VIKLYRAESRDREDMMALWPLCTFATPDGAARASDTPTYPHAPEDEHLAEFICEIAKRRSLSLATAPR
jgi:hypothetical protein